MLLSAVLRPESGWLIFSHPVSKWAISGSLSVKLILDQSNISPSGSLGLRSVRLHLRGSAAWTLPSRSLLRPLNNACRFGSRCSTVETVTERLNLGWRKSQLLDGLCVLTGYGKHPRTRTRRVCGSFCDWDYASCRRRYCEHDLLVLEPHDPEVSHRPTV
jgi:hypothetical protein